MNEEEKKAIDKLQYTIEINQNILDGIEIDEQVIKSMETTLNLIDKQQKEIEELDKENTRQQELIGNIHQKWQDRIKEKMRGEINKSWRNTEQRKCQLYAYDILKELLEGNK